MGVALGMTLTTGCKQTNNPKALQETQDSVQTNENQITTGLVISKEGTTCSETDSVFEDVEGAISSSSSSDKQKPKNKSEKHNVRVFTKFVPPSVK